MVNELVVMDTVQDLCKTVRLFVGDYKKNRILREADVERLKIMLNQALAVELVTSIEAVNDLMIRKFHSTFVLISDLKLSGVELDFAMKQLELQAEQFHAILEEMKR